MDLLVENTVVVELKSVKKIEDIHLAQILTYMKLGKFKVGLILNFNVTSFKDGIRRVVNLSPCSPWLISSLLFQI
jgi:GxxExxY protein